jgi:hypothetical protein
VDDGLEAGAGIRDRFSLWAAITAPSGPGAGCPQAAAPAGTYRPLGRGG